MTGDQAATLAAQLSQLDLDNMDYDTLRQAVEAIAPLVEEPLWLNGIEFRWHKVADPERLLSEAADAGDQSHGLPATDIDPFWAVAWRAAQGLDVYLSRLALDNVRLLELGAGAARAGLAAAARGGLVTITDTVDLALLVARLNSWPVRHQVSIRRLRWGDQSLSTAPYPIIIGSDLVYDSRHFPQLEHCARAHIAPDGQWILSEPNRQSGDDFARWIAQCGWSCAAENVDLADGRVPIRIFVCRPT